MTIGTKSVLFGAHQFLIHPCFVAVAWWELYGFTLDPRIYAACLVHDWGDCGKINLDGKEGKLHPELGAKIMQYLFGDPWGYFTIRHSRYYSKNVLGLKPSKLCAADKLGTALTWRWLYLLCANLTGEVQEYMLGQMARTPAGTKSQWRWFTDLQAHFRMWAYENKDSLT